MSSPDSRVFENEAGFLVARINNLAVILWRDTPTVPAVKKTVRHFPSFEQVRGEGFAVLSIITANCAPIGIDVRRAFDEGMQACRDSALGMAGVVEVQGVLGGLTRALVRTMNIVSRAPYPVNTYATVKEASEWLQHIMVQRGAPTVSSQEIQSFVAHYRVRPKG